jgi:hypothetical protein
VAESAPKAAVLSPAECDETAEIQPRLQTVGTLESWNLGEPAGKVGWELSWGWGGVV